MKQRSLVEAYQGPVERRAVLKLVPAAAAKPRALDEVLSKKQFDQYAEQLVQMQENAAARDADTTLLRRETPQACKGFEIAPKPPLLS